MNPALPPLHAPQIPDPALVRDVIRTNQGSVMMALLLPLHRFKIWILRHLLAGGCEAWRGRNAASLYWEYPLFPLGERRTRPPP